MAQPRFDLGLISKTLNLYFLRFIEQSGFEDHAPSQPTPPFVDADPTHQ